MKCLIGFILFWVAIGMFISLFIDSVFCVVVLILVMLVAGFNLFCR
ncbi:MAG: hypothetical protein PUF12_03805 [Thermoflexaceae bacterium]|nr:hypothetical protein [Thermoflexaceae bacterium]